MDKNLQINEDFERNYLTDLVYLQETQQLLEQEVQKELKQPAHIIVIDKDNVLNETHEHKSNPLPF